MKKEMMISLIVLLFGISFVSAATNYAPTGTPSYANPQVGDNNYLTWTWQNSKLNDGSTSSIAHGVEVSNQARYQTWGSFNSIITFETPVAQMDRIEAVAARKNNMVIRLVGYVDTGSGWQQVGDTGTFQPATTNPYTYTFKTGAPWYNVERIMVYSYSLCAPFAWVKYELYEIRAWGPDICSPQTDAEFCTAQGSACGSTTGNDNCGNPRTVDCGTCTDNVCYNPSCTSGVCGETFVPSGESDPTPGQCDSPDFCDGAGNCILFAGVYWAFLNGSETENAEIGDTVWMIYPDEPGSYNFDIKEKDVVDDDIIKTVPSTETFHRDKDLVADWEITQSDWDLGNDDLDGSLEFFFDVNSQTSGDLNVAKGSYSNDLPETQIILPEYGSNYTLDAGGTTADISFEQISNDPDDYLKGIWTFGDGGNSGWMNYCSKTGIGTDCNTTHPYTKKGAIDIKFRVEEMTRSQWNDDSTKIFVYGPGVNVIAEITEPKYNKTVEGRAVYIDASKSRVINCSYILEECNNAASPVTCDTIDDAEGINPTLYCYQLPNRGIDYNLIFEWTFDGVVGKVGNWGAGDEGYNEYVEFVQGFRDPGEHDIGLRVGYEAI